MQDYSQHYYAYYFFFKLLPTKFSRSWYACSSAATFLQVDWNRLKECTERKVHAVLYIYDYNTEVGSSVWGLTSLKYKSHNRTITDFLRSHSIRGPFLIEITPGKKSTILIFWQSPKKCLCDINYTPSKIAVRKTYSLKKIGALKIWNEKMWIKFHIAPKRAANCRLALCYVKQALLIKQ